MRWRHLLTIALLGLVVGAAAFGLAGMAGARGEKEHMLSYGELPRQVQAAILAEILADSLELEIMESDQRGPRGKVIYEVEYECRGMDIEMEVAANGD
jgi:hypothetical protein